MVIVEGLQKSYEDVIALTDITFELDVGVTVLIGPNGAGKTTTLRCLAGILRPDGGRIEVFGKGVNEVKDSIFFMTEDRKVFRKLRVRDYEKMLSLAYPKWNPKLFRRLLSHFSIPIGKRMEDLSAGVKTQLLVSAAFSSGSELILLDEPTQHLDPVKVKEVETMIREFGNEKIVLVSTHHLEEVEGFADRFVIINEGRTIYMDTVDGAKEKHRVVSQESINEGDEVVGMLEDGFLVKASSDKGRYPRLREIVLAYLLKSGRSGIRFEDVLRGF